MDILYSDRPGKVESVAFSGTLIDQRPFVGSRVTILDDCRTAKKDKIALAIEIGRRKTRSDTAMHAARGLQWLES